MFRQRSRRYLRLGSRGEDVRHVQQLLQMTGHDPGPVDGVFGRRTDQAVRDFQGAAGLVQDGVVGPRSWEALTKSGGGDGQAQGISLHIGLNVVDDEAYGTPIPPLAGCVNDANDMTALARSQGFSTTTLLDRDGRCQNIIDAIGDAARRLRSGDFFLLTYAGHGSQIPDATGDEADDMDETWVGYDRQLMDDELYALWGEFQPGVRILMISDSCHSGTVARVAFPAYEAFALSYQDDENVGFVLDTPSRLPASASRDVAGWADLHESVREVVPSVVAELQGTTATAVRPADVDRFTEQVLAPIRGGAGGAGPSSPPRTRDLPVEIARRDARRREDLYQDVKESARAATPPSAHVLLVSGSQDHQLSLDGSKNGLFTQRLLETWDEGRFSGIGYPEFHRQIVELMPPQQIPNLFWATPADPRFENQRPFTI
ncbi:caspase family protein [Glycomyces xiaoerkulensis]|uniref:caspase family protein n=1 Tax=Glycomyces xiaoerkulensis TaxID=2038139 RepID=UPI000C263F66|nr:caspase family protein [Glycomyces xiaoerkulensis]